MEGPRLKGNSASEVKKLRKVAPRVVRFHETFFAFY